MAPGGEPDSAASHATMEETAVTETPAAIGVGSARNGGESMRTEGESMRTGGGSNKNGGEPSRGLKRYKMANMVGDGTYGLVYLAHNLETRHCNIQTHLVWRKNPRKDLKNSQILLKRFCAFHRQQGR